MIIYWQSVLWQAVFMGKKHSSLESFFPMKTKQNTVVMALRVIFLIFISLTLVSCMVPMGPSGYSGGYGGYSNYGGGMGYGPPPPQMISTSRMSGNGTLQGVAYRQNFNMQPRHSAATLDGGRVVRHTVTFDANGRQHDEIVSTQNFNTADEINASMKSAGVDLFPFKVAPGDTMTGSKKTARRMSP